VREGLRAGLGAGWRHTVFKRLDDGSREQRPMEKQLTFTTRPTYTLLAHPKRVASDAIKLPPHGRRSSSRASHAPPPRTSTGSMCEPVYYITERSHRKTSIVIGKTDCGKEDCPTSGNYKKKKGSSGSSAS